MKSRIRAVLFDYGRTLVSFDFPHACILEALRRFAPELQRELGPHAPSAERILEDVLMKVEDDIAELTGEDEIPDYLAFYGHAWRRAGFAVNDELLYRILDEEQRCWERSITLEPDALDVLDELRRRGLRLALVSNAPFPPEMMRRQVANNGIADRVDEAVFSSEIGERKPARKIYSEALRRLDVPAEDALFVGDRLLEDYEAPRALGMDSVLYIGSTGEVPDSRVRSVRRLTDLLALT